MNAAGDLTESDRVLVVAVHPDDETLGAGGLIQRARGGGAALRIVFVTDGDDNPWPQRFLERRWRIGRAERARWGRRRRQEAIAALRCLGVESGQAIFLGFRDQGLTQALLRADGGVIAAFRKHIVDWHPTVLVVPSKLDLHPDHSACAVLVDLALGPRPESTPPPVRFGYRVHGHQQNGPDGARLQLALTPDEARRKRAAILCYTSQTTLSRRRFLAFAGSWEKFLTDEEPSDHPVRRVCLCGDDLRVHIRRTGGGNPFGRASLYVVSEHSDSSTGIASAVPRMSSESLVRDCSTGVTVGKAKRRGSPLNGEIRLPAAVVADATRAFIKLEHRSVFFDTAGWRLVTLRRPSFYASPDRGRVVCVVPCYNVATLCGGVLRETVGFAEHVVAVDDGSTDQTAAVLRQVQEEYPGRMTVLGLGSNRGKGFALLAGFKHALQHLSFDALVTLDGDGQHLPCDIPDLSRLVAAGADIAIGERCFKLMPLRSRLGNSLTSALVRRTYAGAPVDTQSGLRAFSRNFVEEVVCRVPGSRYEMELHCLLLALSQQRPTARMPISTIYLDHNRSSQFQAIRDSWRIFRAFLAWLRGDVKRARPAATGRAR